ncbi:MULTISPECIES: PHP domain-containing protein [unclassified Arthrobacter]|uniref:PHP domain-containing protein n=1 Tax=unclassified Arthrobacter TaxID=235627 RepID=UPI001D15468D|nr:MULTISPECIES: PHP domain-containing protein [unclassified Arthrobacter]MCC3277794.1 PHP domain-containing protein [Arthrobacter sp. zg-Y40]MCC9176198.1 PHP domain-containing protein [Arthrobacter sp. zg-Y750]MCC3276775.1 PHP domain-containing protein [Arthrobacter sp. zg-Y20]MDK1316933.1 PHP domain-containing protein [Arthrobacter sp. zg.Y20]WIB05351.1 PHP domain-containing protein [Arthrobacter sp. zg-Y20]
MRIDLHTHSSVSDGTEPPADVLAAAAREGLDAIALTDHDTTAGWEPAAAAARKLGITMVPGMEVSCRSSEGISVHVLSYLHDPAHPGLLEEIARSRAARVSRAELMVKRLAEDFPIDWDAVQEQVAPGATIGRPHIADALVAAGVVPNRSAAFSGILTARSPYFVAHYAPDPARAVELVRQAGGVPVFAHPVASSRGRVVGEGTFHEMIDAGLLGVEVNHRDNPEAGRDWLRRLAKDHNLLVTGSSDYHGTGKPNRLAENTTDPAVLAQIAGLGTGSALVGDLPG